MFRMKKASPFPSAVKPDDSRLPAGIEQH